MSVGMVSPMADEEFRVEVVLSDEGHRLTFWDRLRALDLDDDARERLGSQVTVTRDGNRMLLYTHTLLAGMSRTLQHHGVPAELIGELLIEVAQAGSRIGSVLKDRVREVDSVRGGPDGHRRRADIALLTAQLLATGFEVTCGRAATTRD